MKKTEQPTDRASMRRFLKEQKRKANPPIYFEPHPAGTRSERRSPETTDLKHNNPKLKNMKRFLQVVKLENGKTRTIYKMRLLRNSVNMFKMTHQKMFSQPTQYGIQPVAAN
jgi:hypothetical protein